MGPAPNDPPSPALPRAAAAVAIATGVLALVGWIADIGFLRTFGGSKHTNPATAIGVVLAGVALRLFLAPGEPWRRGAGRAFAAAVGAIGAIKAVGAFGVRVPGFLDGWFSPGVVEVAGGAASIRMAPASVVCFILVSASLLLLDFEVRRWRPAELLGLAVAAIGVPNLIGHLAGLTVLAAGTTTPMSLNMALAFAALGVGVADARPDLGFIGRMRRSSLRGQVVIGLGIAGGVLVLSGAVAIWSSFRSVEAAAERRAQTERRSNVERLLAAMLDAETGERGYLLTGDTAFLAPYRSVEGTFGQRVTAIRSGVAAMPDRIGRVDELDSLVYDKLFEMDRNITLRSEGNTAEAMAIVQLGEGKRTMDRMRVLTQSLITDEQAMYDVWDARLHFADRLTLLTSGAGTGLAVVFLALSLLAINQNIRGRELAEVALRESEHRLYQLMEALPVAVFVVDASGKPFYMNRVSQAILGKGADPTAPMGTLPETYQAYVAGTNDLYPVERTGVFRALRGEQVHSEDIELHRPDRVVPVEVWAAPVHDSAGKIQYAVAVFNDITVRQKSEAEIRALTARLNSQVVELTDLNAELEAFTYSVSHDLRAPVRHIDGFARILEESLGAAPDSEQGRYVARIRSGARQMGILIDDLLRLSKIGRQELLLKKSDLNQVLRSVVFDLREETAGREIEWRMASLRSVECDPGLLKHVFVNLLTNALKFTRKRDKAVIEVSEVSVNGGKAFMVKDNGAGFDMQYAHKLFGVFQRLHQQDEFEGTGVGLAIVHRIVRKHGGRVWAEGTIDEGATFYFTLAAEQK